MPFKTRVCKVDQDSITEFLCSDVAKEFSTRGAELSRRLKVKPQSIVYHLEKAVDARTFFRKFYLTS